MKKSYISFLKKTKILQLDYKTITVILNIFIPY